MKDEGFPWTDLGPGHEPRLPADFASRVIEQARRTHARKRRAKIQIGVTAGFAALVATFLWMRAPAENQPTLAHGSLGVAPAIADFDSVSWSDQPDNDLLAVLMPSARQAEKFDAYYGAAGWDTYASSDRDSYDWSRTR